MKKTSLVALVALCALLAACTSRAPVLMPGKKPPGCENLVERSKLEVTKLPPDTNACKGDIAQCRAKCDQGEPWSCATLARRYADGDGVKKDRGLMATYAEKACRAGHPDGCLMAGDFHLKLARRMWIHYQGKGKPWSVGKSECRAYYAYDDACELGKLEGCERLRKVPHSMFSVSESLHQRAADHKANKACREGRPDACLLCTHRRMSVNADRVFYFRTTRDARCYSAACKAGYGLACVGVVAVKAWKAWEGHHDIIEGVIAARDEMQRLCDKGIEGACNHLTKLNKLTAKARVRKAEWRARSKASAAKRRREWANAHKGEMAYRRRNAAAAAAREREAAAAMRRAIRANSWWRSTRRPGGSKPAPRSGSCAGGYYGTKSISGVRHYGYICP